MDGWTVTPQAEHGKEHLVSYIARARETLLKTAQRGKSSLVGFRESRREISPELESYGRDGFKGFSSGRAANATMRSEQAWTREAR